MAIVVNGRDAALWSADAVQEAGPGRHAAAAARPPRPGAHRAGDLVWARICWGVTLAGVAGALLVLAAIAYRSAS